MIGAILPTTDLLFLEIILLVVGLVAIIKGGDWFVDAAVWIAEVLHMPKFLIGATVVSLATTLPEMIVSIIATVNGSFDTAIGNAVGSVTANTGLIMAIGVLFINTLIERKDFTIKGLIILIISSILTIVGFTSDKFGIVPSIILILIFAFYMFNTISTAKKNSLGENVQKDDVDKSKKAIFKNILLFVIGIVGIVLGSDLLVENATALALKAGVSEGIVAITIVAIGTSLPELITTITAVVKKQGELGVGNVIGANILDMSLILPICSFICGGELVVSNQGKFLDMPALLVVSCIAILPAIFSGKLKKWQGAGLLVAYGAYLALAAIFFIK